METSVLTSQFQCVEFCKGIVILASKDKIKHAYIADDVIEQGERLIVDANKVDPVARLGGNNYAAINESFSLARPKE